MLRQIAKNVFNIVRLVMLYNVISQHFFCVQVFILDPASEEGKELVEYVKLFLDHMVPARLGVLFVPQENTDVGVALCRGFGYLSVHVSARAALAWLYKVLLHYTVV